jgi:outer membrane cobalamin receptor
MSQNVVVENTLPLVVKLEEDMAMINELVIVGENSGRTDNSAREMEKSAMNVINVMSARSIEVSPDMTVANVIQRMSGVTLERNSSGDGQYALLRGMDKRFNYTLVNGIKIPSPDNKNRFVPLDIFPSELLDRLEVTKALTADMEGDGIGGAVNMAMKDALMRLQVNANISTGFNSHFFSHNYQKFDHKTISLQSPNQRWGDGYPYKTDDFTTQNLRVTERSAPPANVAGGISIGGRAFNNILGIMLAASYSDAFRGSTSDLYGSVQGDGSQDLTLRNFSTRQIRSGTHAKFDIRLNRNHKWMWYNAYMDFQNIQVRDTRDVSSTNRGDQTVRLRWNKQTIFSSSMKGIHNFADEKLRFDWALAYGDAQNRTPDNLTLRMGVYPDSDDKMRVHIYTTNDALRRRWEENSDNDKSVYANLAWTSQTGAVKTEWSAGGMFRDKKRESLFHYYEFVPSTNIGRQYRGENWENFDEIQLNVNGGSINDALNYYASEEISAGYVQLRTSFAKYQITAGLRLEHTRQGYEIKNPPPVQEFPAGLQEYPEWLPSFHARYMLNNATNLRFSYVKAINRPSFFEIVPYTRIFEDYNEGGNPKLRHTVAHNVDLRYELFPRQSEQFMVGVFYKYIIDPIEYKLEPMRNGYIYTPMNLGDAQNAGIEIDVTKYFRRFGAKANYTFTNSRITTNKFESIPNPDYHPTNNPRPDIWIETPQTRPLFGQAAHVANFSLLYKDAQNGLDAQIALSYTDKRIVDISHYLDRDMWQAGYLRLDASADKHFQKIGITLFVKASNLLNTPMYQYTNPTPADAHRMIARKNGGPLDRKEYYGMNVTVGVKYKL